ncbi:MAG TPA: alpha/beta family hydrolase [Candidatus Binatia bacterium]|nr:alpha/beta family hydrolase [Candidatus Binatia bacterium]
MSRGRPDAAPVLGMLLTPGAGASSGHPTLLAVDRAASARGLAVERIDFPYRLAGRRAPDSPAVLARTVRDAAAVLAARLEADTGRLVLGGRSMGGRVCSEVVAGGLAAAGLVLISYPLHPPGRPDRPRVEHLGSVRVPCLFVSGTRDAFGTPEELRAATARIAGPVSHAWIEGGDHGLAGHDGQVARLVMAWLEERFGLA